MRHPHSVVSRSVWSQNPWRDHDHENRQKSLQSESCNNDQVAQEKWAELAQMTCSWPFWKGNALSCHFLSWPWLMGAGTKTHCLGWERTTGLPALQASTAPGFGRPRRFHSKRGWPRPKAQAAPSQIFSKMDNGRGLGIQTLGFGHPFSRQIWGAFRPLTPAT